MKTPHGLEEVIAAFGDARKIAPFAFEATYIVRVPLPESLPFEDTRVTRITSHRLIANKISDALTAVHGAGLWHALGSYSGGYANRPQRGSSKLSTHAFGCAWDFGAELYPLGSDARMPDALVKIFTSLGFFYGGDFAGRRDPMHVQLASGV
jgi:hypothetical protein